MTREQKNADDCEYRRLLKKLHICRGCKRQDAYTLSGRTYCAECAARNAKKKREWRENPANRAKSIEGTKKQREKWAAEGRCTRCGRLKPPGTKYQTCIDCRTQMREAKTARKIARGTNWPRGWHGYCWQCNKVPAMEGKHLCPECYEMKIRYQKIAAECASAKNGDHIWRKNRGDHGKTARI